MSKSSVKPSGKKGSDRPTIKEINSYGIRDGVATDWYDLGVQLLPDDLQVKLGIIRSDSSTNATACCMKMFEYWLQVDTAASWSKLIEALKKINNHHLAEYIIKEVLKEKSNSVKKEREVETEVNNQQSSMTKELGHPNFTVAVGKQQNNDDGTNGNCTTIKINNSSIKCITVTILLAGSFVFLAICIQMIMDSHNSNGSEALSHQQNSEDASSELKPTDQKEDTSNVPKPTSQGLQGKQGDTSFVLKSTHQKEDSSTEPKPTTSRGYSKEYKVLLEYNDELASNLPTKNIVNKLIAEEIITYDDQEELDHKSTSQEKASFVLGKVAKSLKADDKYFYSLLHIMEEYGGVATKLANKIRTSLSS